MENDIVVESVKINKDLAVGVVVGAVLALAIPAAKVRYDHWKAQRAIRKNGTLEQ